jgi:hypothetical protein
MVLQVAVGLVFQGLVTSAESLVVLGNTRQQAAVMAAVTGLMVTGVAGLFIYLKNGLNFNLVFIQGEL